MSKQVVLLHAYSRSNRGDGVLVDESLRVVRDALGQDTDVTVVALDPGSFSDVARAVEWPVTTVRSRVGAIAAGARSAVRPNAWSPKGLRWLLGDAHLVLGVGGGYLRAANPVETLKTLGAHVPQLAAAAACGVPTYYLPQSVGPLEGVVGRRIRAMLNSLTVVAVRDDTSRTALKGDANVWRCPDLAVLALAEDRAVPQVGSADATIFILRDIGRASAYLAGIRDLLRWAHRPVIAIQSAGRGNNDELFARRCLGFAGEAITAAEAFQRYPGASVVSVRLHGALEAIRNGHPTIHISYERKGWGAFSDLGLSEFVHDARSFESAVVQTQLAELRSDPNDYWRAVSARREELLEDRTRLVTSVREACV